MTAEHAAAAGGEVEAHLCVQPDGTTKPCAVRHERAWSA